ncbi:MAG: 2-C-methyl-D-erythritol 4-phosphate cytidylyltransferase [Alphaproteobacteria bacterium]|nr:2-C-methyl-D-erythritol 4-phosphate cytidylyltransferase [Alphaproteobacteria bacterium]
MAISAIIVAAGSGSRFGGDIPKQYLTIGSQAVLDYSIQAFLSHNDIDEVVVVVSNSHKDFYQPIINKYKKLLPPVFGGEDRSDSVKAGLEALKSYSTEKVLIHDAARPFLSHEVIDRTIEALQKEKAVIPVLPVFDTIKTGDGYVAETVDRSVLNRIQTPQGFCYKTLMQAYAELPSFTDDAQAMEQKGISVAMVVGDEMLLKITTPLDQVFAEAIATTFEKKPLSANIAHKFIEPSVV